MKNVVVTGASGYVGRNLVNKLTENGVFVYAMVRNSEFVLFDTNPLVKVLNYDATKIALFANALKGKEIDAFYHLIWLGAKGAGRSDYLRQTLNAQYTCDALMACNEIACKKFITVGTITEKLYEGEIPLNSAQNSIYGITKTYTHKLLKVLCNKMNLKLVWATLSNIYGGDDDSGNLISYTIGSFKQNLIPEYGPCENPYDFVHIDDVSAALYLLGKNESAQGDYFIGRCENKKLKDYILYLSKIYNCPVKIGVRADDGLRYKKEWFDNSRLTRELNFNFKYTFAQGIEKEFLSRGSDN